MKKLCKIDKTLIKKQLQYRNCIYKCKKCKLQSDSRKSLCKAKVI